MANTHPLVTIFGVIVGLSLFGFIGIIFGPLLVSLFLLFLDMFRKEYLADEPVPHSDGPYADTSAPLETAAVSPAPAAEAPAAIAVKDAAQATSPAAVKDAAPKAEKPHPAESPTQTGGSAPDSSGK